MMNKSFLLLFLFATINSKIYSQGHPKIFLSGISGYSIKTSQLTDTSIKITSNYKDKISGYIKVYFSGAGFQNVHLTTMPIGKPLQFTIGIKKQLTPGSRITLEGANFFIDSAKTKRIYFEESSYLVIE